MKEMLLLNKDIFLCKDNLGTCQWCFNDDKKAWFIQFTLQSIMHLHCWNVMLEQNSVLIVVCVTNQRNDCWQNSNGTITYKLGHRAQPCNNKELLCNFLVLPTSNPPYSSTNWWKTGENCSVILCISFMCSATFSIATTASEDQARFQLWVVHIKQSISIPFIRQGGQGKRKLCC